MVSGFSSEHTGAFFERPRVSTPTVIYDRNRGGELRAP